MGFFKFLKKDKGPKRLAIIDVNDSDFKKQVIQRSYKTTVLVDFWAAWCGPCRHLGPVLEKIAEDPSSDFILAKLDTERNRKTAAQFNIRSIPNVKAFRNGQVVNEFTGALPEVLVKRFIAKVSATPPPAPRLQLGSDPAKRLRLAEQHLNKGRGFEAFVALNEFPESPEAVHANELLPLARFLLDMDDGDGLTGIEALDEVYLAAAEAINKRNYDSAFEQLFTALEVGEEIDQDHTTAIIKATLAFLGPDSESAQKYRQVLSSKLA